MRIESSVTAVSWIPSEAITGPSKIPFELGVTHYDQPPPDTLEDLEELRTSDRFREANELRAFVAMSFEPRFETLQFQRFSAKDDETQSKLVSRRARLIHPDQLAKG